MKRKWLALMALVCLCAPLSGCAQETALPEQALAPMQIAFLGDKAEDAILLTGGDFAVLIDTGLNKTGKEIVSYLKNMGVKHLDMLIVTHYDKDHVGGADAVIEGVKVRHILAADYASDAKQYEQFVKAAKKKGVAIEKIGADTTVQVGSLTLEIDAPDMLYEQENDRSLVVRANYGSCSMLLAGDAENDRLAELLSEGIAECTLLKVPHHGRIEDLSLPFFEAARPRYAVITSADKELEDELVVAYLKSIGAQVYLTRLGLVEGVCDGNTITFTQKMY